MFHSSLNTPRSRTLLASFGALILTGLSGPTMAHSKEATSDFSSRPLIQDGMRKLDIRSGTFNRVKSELRQRGRCSIERFPMPDGSTVELDLRVSNPFTSDAVFSRHQSPNPKDVIIEPLVIPEDTLLLSGEVVGDPDSMVVMTLIGEKAYGQIRGGGHQVMIGTRAGRESGSFIIDSTLFSSDHLPEPCGTLPPQDEEVGPPANPTPESPLASSTPSCHEVRLSLDIHYELYVSRLNGPSPEAFAYVLNTAAAIDFIYKRETGIGVGLRSARAWEFAGGPVDGLTKGDIVNDYIILDLEQGGNEPGEVKMLMMARDFGGLAWNPTGANLCGTIAHAVCGGQNNFPYPLTDFNQTVGGLFTAVHELGHLLNAKHTHEFCPPLDSCAESQYAGSCQSTQTCQQGTVMSYCHSCPGGYGNVRLRFHPANIARIQDYVHGSPCAVTQASSVSANDDEFEIEHDTITDLNVLMNDYASCGDAAINWYHSGTAAGGVVSVAPALDSFGRFQLRYQPPSGFSGEDSFSYDGRDDFGNTDLAEVRLTVKPGPGSREDLDDNGEVNGADLALVLVAWGGDGGPADLNQDGVVDGADLALILAAWGSA